MKWYIYLIFAWYFSVWIWAEVTQDYLKIELDCGGVDNEAKEFKDHVSNWFEPRAKDV